MIEKHRSECMELEEEETIEWHHLQRTLLPPPMCILSDPSLKMTSRVDGHGASDDRKRWQVIQCLGSRHH